MSNKKTITQKQNTDLQAVGEIGSQPPGNGKKKDTQLPTPQSGGVRLITSSGIFEHANIKEAMQHLAIQVLKVPQIENELSNISARLGSSPADPCVVRGRHIFEVKLSGDGLSTHHYFSLPYFVSKDGYILDAATLNKDLIIKAAQYIVNRSRNSVITRLQDQLIDTYVPALKADNISFINFLPLLTNPDAIKATAYVQVHSSILEAPVDSDDRLITTIYEYVVHDDSSPVVIPLLDQKLISSPKVAPILHKLFSTSDDHKGGEKRKVDTRPLIF